MLHEFISANRGKLNLHANRHADGVEFVLRDSGPGIAKESLMAQRVRLTKAPLRYG
jgi:C4-dicarboxylate-specific signal transduction histidine kinase